MLMGAGLNRPERKKSDILAAARGVFLKQGYSAAGMEVVARTAGISTATLYAYFPSKAKLFEVMVAQGLDDMAAPVLESVRTPGDARARLTALANAYAGFFAKPANRAMFRMLMAERRRFETLADTFLLGVRNDLGAAAASVVEELVATGELATDRPSWAAGQLLGMIDHDTLLLGLAAGDETEPERPLEALAADAVETFLARYARR